MKKTWGWLAENPFQSILCLMLVGWVSLMVWSCARDARKDREAREAGRNAAHRGLPHTVNPHEAAVNSKRRLEWLEGWVDEKHPEQGR